MADKQLEKEIADYIAGAKWAVFATVKDGKVPALRTIGGFANDGLNIYFSTGKETDKAKQIEKNSNVAVFFQHEGQERAKFKYVSVNGEATLLSDKPGLDSAVTVLGNKNQNFKQRVEKGELDKIAVYKISPKNIRSVDFSRGSGPASVLAFSV
jgi:general stress protein 26